jgi:hypothetical protein
MLYVIGLICQFIELTTTILRLLLTSRLRGLLFLDCLALVWEDAGARLFGFFIKSGHIDLLRIIVLFCQLQLVQLLLGQELQLQIIVRDKVHYRRCFFIKATSK